MNFECYKCDPQGKPLYLPDISRDMNYPSPCKKQVINTKEIEINGELFYIDDDKRIYSKQDDNYVQVLDPDVINYILASL